MLRKLYYWFSPKTRRLVRRLLFLPLDLLDRREELVPPRGRIFTGRGDFVKMGDDLLENFILLCGLKRDAKVLDIGCGIGRVARPLAKYLNENGGYCGFDIVSDGIEWCTPKYAKYPRFHFKHIPLRNDLYNLAAEKYAYQFVFPYMGDYFDLAVSISVFTHMQQEDVKNYMQEIARVLKKGGHCFATFFLLTKDSIEALDKSPDPFFKYRHGDYFLHDDKVKDANIAYKYELIESMLTPAGLRIKSFHPGWWSGIEKNTAMNYQDVLVIQKM